MGCFDFTYADNGENIRGRTGYIHLSETVARKLKTRKALRFTSTDEYGRFDIKVKNKTISIDIFALYTAMIFFDDSNDQYVQTIIKVDKNLKSELIDAYLDGIAHGKPNADLEDNLRFLGIHYMSEKTKRESEPQRIIIDDETGKWGTCYETFFGAVPLVLTKKPYSDAQTAKEVAEYLGRVSGYDPNQGFNPTNDYFIKFEPKN